MRRLIAAVGWLALAAAPTPADALSLTLVSGGAAVSTSDGVGAVASDAVSFASVPDAGGIAVTLGAPSSAVDYAITPASFLLEFTSRVSSQPTSDSNLSATFYFVLDEDADYALSGSYALFDPEASEIAISLDFDGGFAWTQASNATPNASFVFGAVGGGDLTDVISGSPTGTLSAGTVYGLTFDLDLLTPAGGTIAGAAGSGVLELQLAVVPEPGTGLLLSLGLAALGIRRRGLFAWFRSRPGEYGSSDRRGPGRLAGFRVGSLVRPTPWLVVRGGCASSRLER